MTSVKSITGRAMLVGIVASLLPLYGTGFSQESAQSAPASGVATPDSRLPCPPDAKVDEDVKLIRAAYEAAYDNAKDTGEPDPLIEQLVGLSNETPDPAKKYALLLEAESVATQYENYATALDLLAKRAEKFQIDGLKLKGQLLKRLAGPKVAADLVLFDQASDTAEQAMRAERFDVAVETASLALSVARAVDREQKTEARKRGRPVGKAAGPMPVGPGLVKKATALQSQVTATQKLFAEYGEALADIKSQPNEAAANSVVAQYLCFVRGDWQSGLPALAKSDIDRMKKVATDEISLLTAENRDPKRVFDLAGAWWAASDSKGLTDNQQAAVKDHAAGFYAEVAEKLSDVLEKKLAQSRLRGLAQKPRFVGRQVFLSDLPEIDPVVGFGEFGKNGETGARGVKIIVNNEFSPHGISTHCKEGAEAGVSYNVPPNASKLSGKAAITDSTEPDGAKSPVSFKIVADGGKVLWKSPRAIKHSNEAMSFEVDVAGLRRIRLIASCAGSFINATAVWCEPHFIVDVGPTTTTPNATERVAYLSDLPSQNPTTLNADWPFSTHGQIKFEPIVVGGVKSPKGIGMHPPESGSARVTYEVPKGAKTFEADAAVNDSSNASSPLTFRVVSTNDGQVLWKTTEPLQKGGSSNRCKVDVNGVDKITLYVDCPGSPAFAHAVWVEPRFNIQRDEDKRPIVAYLSDLSEIAPVTLEGHGFGKNGYVLTFAISVRGVKSPKGLGMHPPESGSAQVTYEVPKGARIFKADAAINDSNNAASPLTFRVVATGDGRVLWKSKTPLRSAGESIPCIADVTGVDKITLYVDCPGSPNGAHAVWIEPRFIHDFVGDGNFAGAIVDDVLGMKFVHVPQGSFRMGSPQNQDGRYADENLVDVTLTTPFLISQTEVTQAQWKQLMGSEPWKGKPFVKEGDNYPASHISWEMANEFCNRLTERERLAGRVPNERYTMPTEAQWEYACRAGTQTAYSFGDDKSLLGDYAWWGGHECGGNSRGQEYGHEVATKKPNPWGIYDMHGNMWEWCSDYAAGDQVGGVDPKGPSSGPGRILRGGGWPECPTFLRSANRTDGGPAVGNFGVRVIRVAEPAAPGQAQPDPGRLTGFRGAIGKTIAFNVTGAANGGGVWGSNPYTADSQLARAAVHAGVLRPGESGIVRVTVLPGQQTYDSVLRNGVMSGRWGAYGLSYRIEPNATPTGGSANTKDSEEWTVLFRSDDPSFWNKEMDFKGNYAIPLAEAPVGVRFLRMKRVSSGATVIIPMSNDKLVKNGSVTDKYGWSGANDLSYGGHKLGIYDLQTRGRQGGTDTGQIAVFIDGFEGHQGWGFGNKVDSNDRQYFSWEREEVSKSVFEVAVKASDLTPAESQALLGN